ncbi:NADP-dependent oxidoreductase domain-containing protein, partial [Desarmillaria ectypa]
MSEAQVEFDPKDMRFRRLGSSGLRIPLFSLGLTLGGTVKGDPIKNIIKTAFDSGINMIDTAEGYAKGQSEVEIGRVVKELCIRRYNLVITTKLFWGLRTGPNDGGLLRKHIIEGTQDALTRLQMDYVDVVFAHRCDVNGGKKFRTCRPFSFIHSVPMEEIVRAFNFVIEKGWVCRLDSFGCNYFYWATSEWSAREIEEADHVASHLNIIAPIAE